MQKLIEIVKRAFSSPIQLTFFLSSFSLLILCSSLGFAEKHPIWNPPEYINFRNTGDRTSSTSVLQSKVSSLLNMSESELRILLDYSGKSGSGYDDGGRGLGNNIETAEKVYILALLYNWTGRTDYAWRAAVLLERYAEVFPNWPKSYGNSKGYGIWTNWFHWDMNVSNRLALAYDLIQPSGQLAVVGSSDSEIERLLEDIVKADFGYRLYTSNVSYLRPLGIVIFGRVLDDPKLVHLGYWFFQKHLQEGYCSDGFWAEGTYSYHHQISSRIVDKTYREMHAFYFDGYSDPAPFNYTPIDVRFDPSRYDNYDFETLNGSQLDRIYKVWKNTQLPDGYLPITNDTARYSYAHGNPPTGSLLLGSLGHAVLSNGSGSTQTQARLDFSHAIGHAHYDALHLIYYDKQEEAVGGTGYNEGDRAWNTSTKNANLVIVNGAEQKASYWVDWTTSPYIPGGGGSSVVRQKLSSSTNKHNNITLFENGYKGFNVVQMVEADALDAYSTEATRYKRMLALVQINNNDSYLVDFFRLKGGTQYDWTIHGGNKTYSASTSLPLGSLSGTFGSITISKSATTDSSWNGTFAYSGSGAKEKFSMVGGPGTTVYMGSGLKSGTGNQDYIVARRFASTTDDVNFMATHEVYKSSPHIQTVEKLEFDGADGTAIGMKVTLDNGVTDYIIHTFDEGPSYPEHHVTGINNFFIKGRFAHVRVTNGAVTWMNLLQGNYLSYNSKTLSSNDGDYSYRGLVTRVNRKAAGASENSFEVDTSLPGNGVLDGKTLIITWGNGWKWGYKIKYTSGNRIVTDDEPAFNYNGGGVDMQYFPVPEYLGLKSFPGPVSFLIPGTAIMDINGTVIDTDDISNPSTIINAPQNLRIIAVQ